MFEVGDVVLCYHDSTDWELGVGDKSFYNGERGTIRTVPKRGGFLYGVEFDEWSPYRHTLADARGFCGLCESGHGYWLSKNNLVLDEGEHEEVDETDLARILGAT